MRQLGNIAQFFGQKRSATADRIKDSAHSEFSGNSRKKKSLRKRRRSSSSSNNNNARQFA
jgi:hypothetical protein